MCARGVGPDKIGDQHERSRRSAIARGLRGGGEPHGAAAGVVRISGVIDTDASGSAVGANPFWSGKRKAEGGPGPGAPQYRPARGVAGKDQRKPYAGGAAFAGEFAHRTAFSFFESLHETKTQFGDQRKPYAGGAAFAGEFAHRTAFSFRAGSRRKQEKLNGRGGPNEDHGARVGH